MKVQMKVLWIVILFLGSVSIPIFATDSPSATHAPDTIHPQIQVPGEPPIDLLNEPAPGESHNFFAEFLYIMFILGVMITFLILASWAMKRLMTSRLQGFNTTSEIKVLETRPLSHKAILHLVEIQGHRLIIGESPTSIVHITTLAPTQEDR